MKKFASGNMELSIVAYTDTATNNVHINNSDIFGVLMAFSFFYHFKTILTLKHNYFSFASYKNCSHPYDIYGKRVRE